MTSIDIEKCLNKDGEALYCASLSLEFRQNLKTSLILEDRGISGSKITWKSSDDSVINGFGRVTRPKSGENEKKVIITATLELFGQTKSFEFEFCVKPDDAFCDPEYISDEEFFSAEKAFLDYDRAELIQVKKAFENGDVKVAKQEVFNYFKNHDRKPYLGEKKDRNMIEMMVSGMQCLQRSDRLYRGKITSDTTEYKKKSVPINVDGLTAGETLSLAIVSRFSECCGMKIAGKDYEDESLRPTLLIKTDAGELELPCKDNMVLAPKKKIAHSTEELYVKNYGEFLGNDTYVSVLKFEIKIPFESAKIKEAYLKLGVKKDKNLEGNKEAYILLFAENTWDGKNAKWTDFLWQFANRGGFEEKDSFDVEDGFDFEYFFQRVRFMYFNWAVLEYEESHDENIPYYLIRTMCNFIAEKGDMRTYSKNWHIGNGWYNDNVNHSLTAGWPRALDAAIRLGHFAETLPYLTQSKFMTPEILCCALKYIRDGIYGLIYKSTTKPNGNLRLFEVMGALRALTVYPEFAESEKYFYDAVDIVKNLMLTVTFPDGTYMEATAGYSQGVCADFVKFYKLCRENDIVLPDEFLQRFYKFALYNALIQGPDGESIQYGDQGSGKNIGWQYPELIELFRDEELNYVLTRGDMGKKPEWTSYRFAESTATILRDSWNKDATYLWTQCRGSGSHGHQDDHHITLISKGRVLLCDAGIFTYSSEDPYRKWGISPAAHNTVVIDALKQAAGCGIGKLNYFKSTEEADELSQSSFAYPGFSFARSIAWNKKENVIIVEDTLIPDNDSIEHTYKQMWHMMPTARMKMDVSKKTMYSDFNEGSNIRITLLDDDGILKGEKGWYDYGYQQLAENPFGYFEKENRRGKVTFKTKIEILQG